MNRLLDSVCEEESFTIVCSFINLFVRSFSRVSSSGESLDARFSAESVRLGSSRVLILKRIAIVQWCKRSSVNTTLTKFLSAEERFNVQNRDVVAQLALATSQSSSLHHLTVGERTATRESVSATSGRVWESSLGERTSRTREN